MLLPEGVEVSLDVGKRLALIGANDAAVAPYRQKGDERVLFLTAGEVKCAQKLPATNIGVVIVNGRLPSDVQTQIDTLCDRAHVGTIFTTENGASLTRVAEAYPYSNKGVIVLHVPGVIKRANSEQSTSNGTVRTATDTQVKPNDPTPTPQPPPPNPAPPAPPEEHVSLNSLLAQLERIYDLYQGSSGKIIAHLRKQGVTEQKMTTSAIRQRVYGIRDKRNSKSAPRSVPLQLNPSLTADLMAAIEASKGADDRLFSLFRQTAEECDRLRQLLSEQAKEIAETPRLQEENARLKRRLERIRETAALEQEA